jgi:predicted nucleic acid-binding protein
VNIFLDSNILFSDPFFRDNFARNLLGTIKDIDGKIYISSIVHQEVINNYKRELRKRRKTFGEAFFDLNKILISNIEHTFKNDDYYLAELIEYYQKLMDEGYLVVIPHTDFDMFDEIVNRALNNKKPFDHHKEEFKDTVIWLSYANFVEKHKISGYFLSNNTKEFYASDNKSIHPDLLEDTQRLIPYTSIKEFMTMNSDHIQEIIQEEEERSFLELLNWAQDKLNETYVETIITEEFMENLEIELDLYVESLSGSELNEIMNVQGDITKVESVTLLESHLNTYEREFYGLEIVIYGSLSVDHLVSLYIWNSYRDKGEDPNFYIGDDVIEHRVEFTFTINKEFKAGNFEVKDIKSPIERVVFTSNLAMDPEELF